VFDVMSTAAYEHNVIRLEFAAQNPSAMIDFVFD
jgi:hypothetical protein